MGKIKKINTSIPRRKMTSLLLASPLIGAGLLAGCKSATTTPRAITQTGGTISLGVSSIDIINEYNAPGANPYIDHLMTPNPTSQITDWAGKILTPVDDRGNLLITITRAALTEDQLEGEDSIKGFFTNEQTRVVRAELEAYFSFSHPESNRSASLTVKAEFETTIAENSTPNEADTIRLDVIRESIGRFDMEFRRQLDMVSGDGWPKG